MIRWLSSAPPPGRQIREGLGCVPVQEFHLQGDQQVSGAWPAMGSAQEHAGLHAEEGQDGTWSTARNLAFHRCVLQRHSFMSVGNRYRQGRSLEGAGRAALDLWSSSSGTKKVSSWKGSLSRCPALDVNSFAQSLNNVGVPLLSLFSIGENEPNEASTNLPKVNLRVSSARATIQILICIGTWSN